MDAEIREEALLVLLLIHTLDECYPSSLLRSRLITLGGGLGLAACENGLDNVDTDRKELVIVNVAILGEAC